MSEAIENCGNCSYLRKTQFNHNFNGKILYYCNSLKNKGVMEKTVDDFTKCEFFDKNDRI